MGNKFGPKFHNNKKCYRCGLRIDEIENYATLISHSGGKIVHQDNWHAKCWEDHVSDWVTSTVRKMAARGLQVMPDQLKDALKEFIDDGGNPAAPIVKVN